MKSIMRVRHQFLEELVEESSIHACYFFPNEVVTTEMSTNNNAPVVATASTHTRAGKHPEQWV